MGPNGLLNQLTKNVLETALDAEMSEYLGYDKQIRWAGDQAIPAVAPDRRRSSPRSVRSGSRCCAITNSSFEPQIVRKCQRRLTGIDQIVLSLTAKRLTTGEIAAHFDDVYGATVSKESVGRITDRVVEEMTEWCNRPLEPGVSGGVHRCNPTCC